MTIQTMHRPAVDRRCVATSRWLLRTAIPALLACTGAASLKAADNTYLLRAGGYYSDNLGRAGDGHEIGAATLLLGARADYTLPSGPVKGHLLADLSYADYLSSAFEKQLVGNLAGSAEWSIVPRLLTWSGEVGFGQVRRDLVQPLQPGNVENILNVNTGPTLRVHMGSSNLLELQGLYGHTSYQRRNFDNSDTGGKLLLAHLFSPRTSLGVGASYDRISYADGVALGLPDLTRKEAYARLTLGGVRTNVSLDAGEGEMSGGTLERKGAIARFSADRKITPYLTGYVTYTRDYPTAESPEYLTTAGKPLGAIVDPSLLTAGPRQTDAADAGLTWANARSRVEFSFGRRHEESLVSAAGARTTYGLRAAFSRRVGPRSRAGVYVTTGREDIAPELLRARDSVIGTSASISLGGLLGVDFIAEHHARSGSSTAFPYKENMGGVYLRYGVVADSYTGR